MSIWVFPHNCDSLKGVAQNLFGPNTTRLLDLPLVTILFEFFDNVPKIILKLLLRD